MKSSLAEPSLDITKTARKLWGSFMQLLAILIKILGYSLKSTMSF